MNEEVTSGQWDTGTPAAFRGNTAKWREKK